MARIDKPKITNPIQYIGDPPARDDTYSANRPMRANMAPVAQGRTVVGFNPVWSAMTYDLFQVPRTKSSLHYTWAIIHGHLDYSGHLNGLRALAESVEVDTHRISAAQ